MTFVGIVAVSVRRDEVITDDDRILPITNMLDSFGDETDDSWEADAVIAYDALNGVWLSIDLSDSEEMTLN